MSKEWNNLENAELIQALGFPPCELTVLADAPRKSLQGRPVSDGVLQVSWRKYRQVFAYVFRPAEGPKLLQEAAAVARLAVDGRQLPLVIAPFLSEDALLALEALEVSGLDLCGNGILIDPPRLLVRRSGASRPEPPPSTGRNVYRGVTSLVPRLFLVQPSFASPAALLQECRVRLGGAPSADNILSQSTVSKAVMQMQADLLIDRQGKHGSIALIRPADLLERVQRNHGAPRVSGRLIGKPKGAQDLRAQLAGIAAAQRASIVVSGLGSATFHTMLAGPTRLVAYVSSLAPFVAADIITPTVAFPSVELIETTDPRVYFDARAGDTLPWASPLQTYLELAEGGPREQETAAELRRGLLHVLEQKR